MAVTQTMRKRDEIIEVAARLIHLNGFNHTSVDDILSKAKAGKGQFYHYFRSKDELGMAVIDRAAVQMQEKLTDRVEAGEGLEAIDWMFRCFIESADRMGCGGGCPIGNLAAEMSDLNEDFRKKLRGVFELWRESLERALREAQRRGQIGPQANIRALANLLLSTVEGAVLLSKVHHDVRVMEESFSELRGFLGNVS